MPPLDFPANPVDGQTYLDFVYDATVGVWRAQASGGGFPITVANGGTGATTVAGALDNLNVGMTKVVPTAVTYVTGTGSSTAGYTTFNACTGVTLQGVFTAKYDVYHIVLIGSSTDSLAYMQARLVSGTTIDTTSNYGVSTSTANSSSISFYAGSSATPSMIFGLFNPGTNTSYFAVDLSSPFLTNIKSYSGRGLTDGSTGFWVHGGGGETASKNGLHLFVSSGTFSGKVVVYGYNKG